MKRLAAPLLAATLAAAGCGEPNDDAVPVATTAPDAGTSNVAPDPGGIAPDAGGPRVMVRIGHAAQPDFLDLDACFADAAGVWAGPVWRDDWAHGATWGRITSYARIAPGVQKIRFVAHQSADCNTPIVGLADLALDVPLVATDHDTWFTVMALGKAAATGADAFRIQTLVDRESVADTPFGLRLVTFDPARSPLELGSIPNADYTGYDQRIPLASFGAPSPYTSWQLSLPTPLYFGLKVFPQGQTDGTPLITGERAQSDVTAKGSWTLFVLPPRATDGAEAYAFCTDGADGPRLCYPCGRPGCEGL